MRLELRPELPAGEREALVSALQRLLEEPREGASAWWEAGVLGDSPAAEEAWGGTGIVEP